MASESSILDFENVGLTYPGGPEVLRDISFTLEPGDFNFLMGPSGAGKSTMLRLSYLGLKPSRGVVSMFGRDVTTMERDERARMRRRIGVVFQDFRLLDHLSAFENVALPLRVAGVRESSIKKHVEELLEWVGLKDYMKALPPTMSGGQQQRVSIARAVIGKPDLLLADEPTGNVDHVIARRIMHLFEELNKLGATVLIATHSERLVRDHRHSVLRLDKGLLSHGPAVRAQRRAAK